LHKKSPPHKIKVTYLQDVRMIRLSKYIGFKIKQNKTKQIPLHQLQVAAE